MSNTFRSFLDAGYTRLVSIVPVGAPISEKSTLFKRPKAVGKAPGLMRHDGLWVGYDWLKHTATEADLDVWNASGAGVGIRTGNGLVALDIDTLDEELAARAEQLAIEHLGIAPLRVGNWPKRLLPFRVSEPTPYQRVKFRGGLVELLSDDRQFVAHGIHPITGKPYTWQPHVWPYESLTEITGGQLQAYFAAVAREFPAAEPVEIVGPSADRASTDQAQLLGDLEIVTRAVAALPNPNETFKTYDDYIRVGAAIKGATQDEHEGLALFQEWAAKWDGGLNDPEIVEADWHRIKPPYGVGAQYLYSLAEGHGGFSTGDAWFTAASPSTSPFDALPSEPETPQLEPIKWADLNAWHVTEPPPQEWEVQGFIPREEVTLLYGEGGVGKTLAMHQYAVCAAAGVPWLGQPVRQGKVMAVFCEDSEKELHRRHKAIMRATGVTPADMGDRLRISSRTGFDNVLGAFNRSSNAIVRTAFWKQVHDEAVAWGADVVIVDTIADTFGGSEIDRGQVNAFVKTVLGGLAQALGGSVIALGHPSVAGRGEGRSGSTAWSNAARSRIYLRRPKGKEKGNARELEGMKANRGPVGNLLAIKWEAGAFALVAESKPIDLEAFKKSEEAAAVACPAESIEEREERAVLAALTVARLEGVALGLEPQVWQRYAPKQLRLRYGALMEPVRDDQEVVADVVRRLLGRGRIVGATWRAPGRTNIVAGYEVASPVANSVFD